MLPSEFRRSHNTLFYWASLVTVVVTLYFTTWVNYLLFHSIVELFSIIIASTVFVITWNSLQYIRNPYLVMVGISYLFIGILDLLHTLSYAGMPIFTDYDFYANQLWIAARYLESITLLVGLILLHTGKTVRAGVLYGLYLVITVFLIASIFYWKIFPICFVAGQGLTPFKIYSEYVICLILAASIFVLARNRRFFSGRIYGLILLSIVFAIISELSFTFYISNYGISNLVGHYFKLFSFLMIYHAIVTTAIEDPHDLIFKELDITNRSLKEAEAALKKLNQELEERVKERTAELHEKDQLLLVQGRQAAMGEMIGHIAHQWRQPLNTLALMVQEVPLTYEFGELNKEYIERYANNSLQLIQHMSQTVDDFRNFFKPDKEKVSFSVNQVVDKTFSLVNGTFREQHIEVELVKEDDPVVAGFPNELSQVLLNLLINARDALVERKVSTPKVVVRTAREAGRAVITVTDNAGGIGTDIIARIFDPYFTTKGAQAGTGVGLSMSKTIIEKNMGGRLTVQNVADGAEFRIEI